jgi:hypothetical protein
VERVGDDAVEFRRPEGPIERAPPGLGRQPLAPAPRRDRPADLDHRLTVDIGAVEADVADQLAPGALAPPPQAVADLGELGGLALDDLERLRPAARARDDLAALRPVPRPDARIRQLAVGELEMQLRIGNLGDEPRALRR